MVVEWNPDFYKQGYEGFERDQNFPTTAALDDYRRLLLGKTEHQVAFIARHTGNRPLRVLEVASGNGRLLVGLARQGLLEHGVGIEIAQSRAAFAMRWADDLGLSQIRSVAADALTFDEYPEGSFDLAVCLTGAFNYFRPIAESAPGALLSRMRRALRPDGMLLLEVYELPEQKIRLLELNDGRLRMWQPLPPQDRFAYYLDDWEYCADRRIMRHGKVFIGRDGTIDAGREEVLVYYDEVALADVVRAAGFDRIRMFADFTDGERKPGVASATVVLAQSPA